jgi:hypothetical protein
VYFCVSYGALRWADGAFEAFGSFWIPLEACRLSIEARGLPSKSTERVFMTQVYASSCNKPDI